MTSNETYNPIVRSEDIAGWLVKQLPQLAPGRVFVISSGNAYRTISSLNPIGFIDLYRYTHFTEIDVSDHMLEWSDELPSEADGGVFKVSIRVECSVDNAERIARKRITDARRAIEPLIVPALREISSTFSIRQRLRAERELTRAIQNRLMTSRLETTGFRVEGGLVTVYVNDFIRSKSETEIKIDAEAAVRRKRHEREMHALAYGHNEQKLDEETTLTSQLQAVTELGELVKTDPQLKLLLMRYLHTGNEEDIINPLRMGADRKAALLHLEALELIANSDNLAGQRLDELILVMMQDLARAIKADISGLERGNEAATRLAASVNAGVVFSGPVNVHGDFAGRTMFKDGGAAGQGASIRLAPPRGTPTPSPGRYLVGRSATEAQVGRAIPIQVRVGLADRGGTASVALRGLSVPAEGAVVALDIYAPGFVVRSDATLRLAVPGDADSQWARFELEARSPGNHVVEVNAWNDGAFLGSLALPITVTTKAAQGEMVERTGGMAMRDTKPGEVTLDVQYDDDRCQYRFQLRGEAIGTLEPFWSSTFPGGRNEQLAALVTQMNEQARNLQHYSEDAARRWLMNTGAYLWKSLIPQPLQEAFWQNIDKIGRLNIISPADPLPWEMICPYQAGKPASAVFLADRITVTRWTYGPPPAKTLSFTDPYVVLPDDAPTAAKDEAAKLQHLLAYAKTITDLDTLNRTIEAAQFGLLHFATHNVQRGTGPLESYVPMNGFRFSQAFLGPQYDGLLRDRSPLVFMNACTAAGVAPAYTGMTGWAHCFLGLGAGSFIGTLWEIRDTSAQIFADILYTTLLKGGTMGDAMRAGRAAISDKPGDPTWLAYTLYGDPNARLVTP